MKLRHYQEKAIALTKKAWRDHKRVILQLPTGAGKCHGIDTPIMMADGSIKPVQFVQIGDLLMGDDATPRKVINLVRGKEELFEITPTKGDSWVCNKSHTLSLRWISENGGGKIKKGDGFARVRNQVYDHPLSDWLKMSRTQKHSLKQYRVPIESFLGSVKPDLDPWLMGVYLGDGHKKNGDLNFNDQNKSEVCHRAALALSELGYVTHCSRDDSNHGITLHVTSLRPQKSVRWINLVNTQFDRDYDKHSLYIPPSYKFAGWGDRVDLLSGLIDADGSYDGRSIDWSSSSEELADDFCFVARSLGLAAYKTRRTTAYEKNGKRFVSYRVSVSGDFTVLNCARFEFPVRLQRKSVRNTGFSVRSLGVGDYYGFTIDGNHRYLLGDFTVTHNSASAAHLVGEESGQVLWLTHRRELIEQSARAIQSYLNNPVGIIRSGVPIDSDLEVQVASIQTLIRRDYDWLNPSLIVVDEAHLSASKTFRTLLDRWSTAKVLGLTATPWRMDGKSLSDVFDYLVPSPISVKDLIAEGSLSSYKLYAAAHQIDPKTARTKAGDYNPDDLYDLANHADIMGDVVSTWQEYADGRQTIVFTINVEHANQVADLYKAAGVNTAVVTGADSVGYRDAVVRDFQNKIITVVVNCDLFTAGNDIPGLDCVQLLCPTKSLTRYLQQIGRALRPGDRHAVILDHTPNYSMHGAPDDPRIWSLEAEPVDPNKRQFSKGEYAKKEKEALDLADRVDEMTKLFEINPEINSKYSGLLDSILELEKIRAEKGYKKTWIVHKLEPLDLKQLRFVGKILNFKAGWADRWIR